MALRKQTRELIKLARQVKKLFPGYKLGGVDPGFELIRWEKHDSGKSTAVDRIAFTEMSARCLLERKAPKRVTRRDL